MGVLLIKCLFPRRAASCHRFPSLVPHRGFESHPLRQIRTSRKRPCEVRSLQSSLPTWPGRPATCLSYVGRGEVA
jgi:hypothetical protein